MAVRETTSCVLLSTLFIAPAAGCLPVLGDEPPAGFPADLTARVDASFRSGIVAIARAVPSEPCTAVSSFQD